MKMIVFTNHKKWYCRVILIITLFLTIFTFFDKLLSRENDFPHPKIIRIGTGGLYGVYYPIGSAIAEGITLVTNTNILAVSQTSGGSVANVNALMDFEVEIALVQADVAYSALTNKRSFKQDKELPVRAIASLYPEKLHIVAHRDAGIYNVSDFRTKTVSLDETGSGTLMVMRVILSSYGISEKDFNPLYLKPEFTLERLVEGDIQAICIVAGTPVPAIKPILEDGFQLVGIESHVSKKINNQYPFLVPGLIPKVAYTGLEKEIPTVEVYALLVVHEKMEEDIVYKILTALWDERTIDILNKAHPQSQSITFNTANKGVTIPFHQGAIKYYKDHGLEINAKDR